MACSKYPFSSKAKKERLERARLKVSPVGDGRGCGRIVALVVVVVGRGQCDVVSGSVSGRRRRP